MVHSPPRGMNDNEPGLYSESVALKSQKPTPQLCHLLEAAYVWKVNGSERKPARVANHLDLKDGHALSCPSVGSVASSYQYRLQRRSFIAKTGLGPLYTAWHSEQEDMVVVKLIKRPQEHKSIEPWMREYRYHDVVARASTRAESSNLQCR